MQELVTVTETEIDEQLLRKYWSWPYESIENIWKMMRENYIGTQSVPKQNT